MPTPAARALRHVWCRACAVGAAPAHPHGDSIEAHLARTRGQMAEEHESEQRRPTPKPCPLKQLHEGLLASSAQGSDKGGGSPGNSSPLSSAFLIKSALRPAGSMWRQKKYSVIGSARNEEQSTTMEGSVTTDPESSHFERSVDEESSQCMDADLMSFERQTPRTRLLGSDDDVANFDASDSAASAGQVWMLQGSALHAVEDPTVTPAPEAPLSDSLADRGPSWTPGLQRYMARSEEGWW